MYDVNKLSKLAALQVVAEKMRDCAAKTELAELSGRVERLEGAEIPDKVSQLINDSNYQTRGQVEAAVQAGIAAAGHASYQRAEAVPAPEEARENILYLVMNTRTGHYDIYAKVDGSVVLLDDTTVDLSGYATLQAMSDTLEGYATSTAVAEALEGYVPAGRLDGAVAALEAALADKLGAGDVATDAEVAEMLDAVFAAG